MDEEDVKVEEVEAPALRFWKDYIILARPLHGRETSLFTSMARFPFIERFCPQ